MLWHIAPTVRASPRRVRTIRCESGTPGRASICEPSTTTGTCRYQFDYLSAFEWVQLSTPDWNTVYVPVTSSTDPTAFEYAGRAWTLMSSAPNGPVCAAAGACGGGVAVPDSCDGLTDADWSAYYDYLYFTGVYTGDPAKLEILMNCEV